MAPSPALQARIRQFETLDNLRSARLSGSNYPPVRSISAEQPTLTGSSQSSLIDEPLSPTVASYSIIQPSVPYVTRKQKRKSPSPSPPKLGLKTSLIDLKDWVLEDGPESRQRSAKIAANAASKPVIAPPLPPRKTSQTSSSSGANSSKSRSPFTTPPIVPSRSSSNSLTVEHTYPPIAKSNSSSNLRQAQGHVSASSTSSFHSVSLSSDGGTDGSGSVSNFIQTYPMDKNGTTEPDADKESVDDSFSFETVSSTGISSPAMSSTHDWEKDFSLQSIRPEPPKLPNRRAPLVKPSPPAPSAPASIKSPHSTSSSPRPSFSSNVPSSYVRRVPPPPPPSRASKASIPPSASSRNSLISNTSTSDRSSIFSNSTITTAHTSIGSYTQLLRPTPVPLIARKRYEALYFANVNAQRRLVATSLSPRAADKNSSSPSPTLSLTPRKGWRGLSVDLITNPDEIPKVSTSEDEAESMRLEAQVVKVIWSKSKIQPEKLKDIWSECALPGQTHLDKDGFVKGMWRIDEELRRLQNVNSSLGRPQSSKRTTIDSLLH